MNQKGTPAMVCMGSETWIGKPGENHFKGEGRVLVSKVTADTGRLKQTISKSVDLVGGLDRVVQKGDVIWLKPNFNTDDPPPGSSDPDFVQAVIELLYNHGAGEVIVGESSMVSLSTRKVLTETGMVQKAEQAGAKVVFFDEGKWVSVSTGGKYLRKVGLPAQALGAEKLVYVCCMKTHRWAKFTLSLKLAVGFMRPSERMGLHIKNLEEKIADLNLVVNPSLIIMDGRKCFINGGPACGEPRYPNVVLASGDRIAIDAEAVRIIENYEGSSLSDDPWNYTQIRRGAELGMGVRNDQEYVVIDGNLAR